jgi:hypothetical protein
MKKIELKKSTTIAGPNGQEFELDTKALIRGVLDQVPERGFSVSDLRARARIDAALENVNGSGELLLEDQDYDTLKKCVAEARFTVRSKFIIDFVNSLL